MIKVDDSDLKRFAVEMKVKAKDKGKVADAIRKSTLSVEAKAKSNLTANGSVKTGHLRRGIGHKLSQTEGEVHTSNIKYAKGVEEGNRPHIIRPKKGKALYWKGAKHPVKYVKHPGSKAKPYLVPALESEKPKFIENLKEAIKFE